MTQGEEDIAACKSPKLVQQDNEPGGTRDQLRTEDDGKQRIPPDRTVSQREQTIFGKIRERFAVFQVKNRNQGYRDWQREETLIGCLRPSNYQAEQEH